MIETEPAKLYRKANEAGLWALQVCTPSPMNVTDGVQVWHETEGMCGFAWVNIKPARGPLVAYLKSQDIGRTDDYYGGYTVWVHEGNQSVDRKRAYAAAFAKVLRDAGLEAYAHSRLD